MPLLLLPLLAGSASAQQQARDGHPAAQALQKKSLQPASTPVAKPVPLLPVDFAGLPREGTIVIESSAAAVDAAAAPVLKEAGFVEADTAQYTASGAVGWKVQAIRFVDATGALSAFTFYRNPAMHSISVGDDAAANPSLFLARSGATLIVVQASGLAQAATQAAAQPATQDATRLKPAMDALVAALPKARGPAAIPPILPGLLPTPGLQAMSMHYAIGPAAYNGALPVSAIDFSRDAEAATAHYRLHSGADATLTLLMFPTPQIAGAAVRSIAALPDATLHVATRRTGPLVGVVSGTGVAAADARQLLAQISYVSDLTMNQPEGYTSEVAKTARLLVSIAYITGFLGIAAVVVAAFLGFGRVLFRRLRGKPDSSMNDDSFITLKL